MGFNAFNKRLASTASLLAFVVAAPAFGQAAADNNEAAVAQRTSDGEASEAGAADIVVTGSRIASAGFTAPTPVTVLGSEQLVKASPSTLADSLRQLPALSNMSGPQRNSGTTNGGQSFLNLRSLGATRTLTLLDGRRVVATNLTGSVDLNILPAGIVQRVEVVTGGASAAYGSDAVAGVVNLILDKQFKGVKGEVNAGIAQEGDNREFRATLSAGTSFADGRGHILLSGEYFNNKGIKTGARKWASQGVGFINNPNGTPTFVLERDIRTVGTFGGMITTGVGGTAANNAFFRGIQFLPGGVTAPYNFGTMTTSTLQVGGDGVPTELIQEINRPLERGSVFGRASFDVVDNVTIYTEGLFGKSTSTVDNSWNRHQTANPITIRRDNAYLPTTIRDQMLARGVTSLTMLRFSPERGMVKTKVDSETYRAVIGFDAKLGALNLDGYYQYGRTVQDNDTLNSENVTRFTQAVDAVVNPANGQIVCRSTLTAPTDGCVPFNVFGVGAPSEAALDYTRGTSSSHSVIEQEIFAANLAGPLVEGWAGPISFAVGGEYRKERANVTTDAISPTGAFLFGNPSPWSGRYNVKEAYAELVVPLLRNVPLVSELDLNAAGRVTDYSTSGSVKTWKVGLSYKPFDDLRFRGTRSRDIRAPNLSELFQAGRQNVSSVDDPANGNVRVIGIPTFNTGNASLKPEIADTLTFGAIYSPTWLSGFNVSVDYYDIKIKDAIGSIGAQTAVDQCYAGVAAACSVVVRNSSNTIVRFNAFPINLASAKVNGLDIEASYRAKVGVGSLNLRALASYIGKQEQTTPGATPIDRAGEVGLSNFPRWQGVAQVNYDTDRYGGFLQMRYVGGGRYDVTRGPAVIDLQHIPAQAYLDGQISFKPDVGNGQTELFLNVRNILNNDPPYAPSAGNVPVAVNVTLHDSFGRLFRVGARFKF
ncbi:TonB-dependent receptor plug domain-containing protein [Sphingobium sp. CR28]|uniref:TonB-dependent receptor plug domain-containing protein n=1 Tax=Sphingobium sp. CR28 TaxID=3400272 RepID=UPI003FEF60E3